MPDICLGGYAESELDISSSSLGKMERGYKPMTVLTKSQYHVELFDGEEREKPVPKQFHGFTQTWLIAAQIKLLPKGFWPYSELNVRTGGSTIEGRAEYVIPDICVVRKGQRFEEGDLAEPPLWAVEIRSPGQTFPHLVERATRLLTLGCPTVWLLYPEVQKAWIFENLDMYEVSHSDLIGPMSKSESIRIAANDLWAAISDGVQE